jgi:NTE family protein
MFRRTAAALVAASTLGLLAACASRPVNPPITEVNRNSGYRFQTRQLNDSDPDNLIVLAFSGGGTRAAAFSYGVLEVLRRTYIKGPGGKTQRLLDSVDVITGVSGGSFTALAYGLYGDKLFDDYEQRFLKRNIQGDLIARFFKPSNWAALWSGSWGRSEMAAELYDEVLFDGATFRNLDRRDGPLVIATATDISSGSRISFTQTDFDVLCSDLDAVPLSRAAAASSAVPVALSPVTINNYGGTCGYRAPSWVQALMDPSRPARPAGRAIQRFRELGSLQDSENRPYIHLVDGGISDNLGIRSILEAMEELEAVRAMGRTTRLDNVRRMVVFVVNSLSVPRTDWDRHERPPNDLAILLKATGVPIDRYSYEAVELLKDIVARWKTLREVRGTMATLDNTDPRQQRLNVPDIEVYAIDVSFAALTDKAEFDYLNDLPTSFVLTGDQVDRLRAAAGTAVLASPEFKRLLKDVGTEVVTPPPQ